MTRFVYLSDTHIGGSGRGYHQQPAYPDKIAEILKALTAWIDAHGPVDFVLHGGDIADEGSRAHILRACEQFRLPVPVYLCLGNHDLTEKDSRADWLHLGAHFFLNGSPDYLIETGECAIHVLPNQWGASRYFWGHSKAHPGFLAEQWNLFEENFRRTQGKWQLFATHSPVLGIPCAQTGLPKESHEPKGDFRDVVLERLRKYPSVHCVLGAHNHVNTHRLVSGMHFVTSSSLVETPFEFKFFEVSKDMLRMRTVSLKEDMPFDVAYDETRTYVQGRVIDREFTKPIPG